MAILNKHIVNTIGRGQFKNSETFHAIRRTTDGNLWYQKRDKNKKDSNNSWFDNNQGQLANDDNYVEAVISTISGVSDTFTGNGSTTNFTLSIGNHNTFSDRLYVTIDSNVLTAVSDYTVSGNTLTLNKAPHNGAVILVEKINKKYNNNVDDLFQQYRFETGDAFYFINSDGYLIRRENYKPTIPQSNNTFSTYDGDSIINPTTYQSAV
jgi:hypothetical protein